MVKPITGIIWNILIYNQCVFIGRSDPQSLSICERLLLLQAIAVPTAWAYSHEAWRSVQRSPETRADSQVCGDREGSTHMGHSKERWYGEQMFV